MNKSILKAACAVSVAFTLAGCLATPPPQQQLTPEQKAMVEKQRQALLARLQGGLQNAANNQANTQTQAAQPAKASLSETEMLAKKEVIDTSGGGANFKFGNDGLYIDGNRFFDTEGQIINAGFDAVTGSFTYALLDLSGNYIIKYARAKSIESPMIIANMQKRGNSKQVDTISGKRFAGNEVVLTAKGFIVGRSNAAFEYRIGEKNIQRSLPKGYGIASLQRGDIASTGYVLLEKVAEQGKQSQTEGLFSSLRDIGRTFGVAEADDYAILNVETGKAAVLDVSINRKNVSVGRNCQRQNDYVNKCNDFVSFESLYDKFGMKNAGHYFWAVDWLQTPIGPAVIYNTGQEVRFVDLNGGQVYVLFSRALGVNDFDVEQQNGTISVAAKLGFSSDNIPDLMQHLLSQQGQPLEMKTL